MRGLVCTPRTLGLGFTYPRAPDFRTNRPSDVISTLVSIYDSKDLFVKELQVLLAQRLLAIQDGNFDNEVRTRPSLTLALINTDRGCCREGTSRS